MTKPLPDPKTTSGKSVLDLLDPILQSFFDRGSIFDPENIGLRLLAEDIENDRYIEIWNVVCAVLNC